jgi:GLPGLI family protein
MDNLEMPKDVTITAWYTPEIPVNQGPENIGIARFDFRN